MCCGTVSRRIFWRAGSTSESFRFCSDIHELETTTRYAHVSTEVIAGTASPLDKLPLSVTPPR